MRFLLGQTEDVGGRQVLTPAAAKLLEDFVGAPGNLGPVLDVLGIDGGGEQLEETSCMAGGAVAGAGGPALGPTDDEEDDDRPLVTRSPSTRGERKRQQQENLYMSLVNEVYELFIERGILT